MADLLRMPLSNRNLFPTTFHRSEQLHKTWINPKNSYEFFGLKLFKLKIF